MSTSNESTFNENELVSESDIELALEGANYAVELGEKMERLEQNEDFIAIFRKHFIDDWAITNTVNMAVNTSEVDRRVFEKMKARGHFCKFCEDLKEDAKYAKEALAQRKVEAE